MKDDEDSDKVYNTVMRLDNTNILNVSLDTTNVIKNNKKRRIEIGGYGNSGAKMLELNNDKIKNNENNKNNKNLEDIEDKNIEDLEDRKLLYKIFGDMIDDVKIIKIFTINKDYSIFKYKLDIYFDKFEIDWIRRISNYDNCLNSNDIVDIYKGSLFINELTKNKILVHNIDSPFNKSLIIDKYAIFKNNLLREYTTEDRIYKIDPTLFKDVIEKQPNNPLFVKQYNLGNYPLKINLNKDDKKK